MENLDAGKLFSVEGFVAVVTGGGTGLGLMAARALAANGASKVYILGRREQVLKDAAAANNNKLIPIVGDVTSKESLQRAYNQIASTTDHVDVVIASSGITGPPRSPPSNPISDFLTDDMSSLREFLWNTPMEDFTQTFHVNVTGAFYTLVCFMPLLDAANKLRPPPSDFPRAQFIVMTSIASFIRIPFTGWAYAASKAAVTHLTKAMSTTFARAGYGLRINGIAPGIYYSPMTAAAFRAAGAGADGRSIAMTEEGQVPGALIPAARCGKEEDMAGVVLWLCSRAGNYVNGNIVVTDGGRVSTNPATY
ncbi:MAG: hypothetical protein M1834_002514 [Cirrosporium novae-zelandiae]|nr:MAG: hypothetical protein M1834_002514 [Cirrosporium novae-zelandiae]